MTNYRDIYALVNLNEGISLTCGQTVLVYLPHGVFTDINTHIGNISNYIEDVLELAEPISCLRNDWVIARSDSENFVIANEQDLIDLGLSEGTVVFTQDNYAVLYFGLNKLNEDMDTAPLNDFLETTSDEDLKSLNEDEVMSLLNDMLQEIVVEKEKACAMSCEREEEVMDNLFGNLGFGKLRTDRFKLSMNGIAVRKDGGYVVYNKDTNEFVDVSNLIFDIKDAIFVLPSAEVSAGDMVIHEGLVYTVVSTKNNEIKAVSYEDCTQTVLIPKTTMFGIKYFNKVFSILGDNFAANGDLFSNPMMLMALIDGKDSSLSNIMLMNAMSTGDLASNPMALAMLLKGDKSDDSLSTLAFMSMFNKGTNPLATKTTTNKD